MLAPAQAPELARGQVALLLAQVLPQLHVRQEVGGVVGEAGVQLVGGRHVVGGSLAGILDGQAGGDDQHLPHAAVALGLQHRAPEAGVDGQAGQAPADGGETQAAFGRPTSSAPSSNSRRTPSVMPRASGGSMNGNAATAPRPMAIMRRMTYARLVRRISGSVKPDGRRSPPRSRGGCRPLPRPGRTAPRAGRPPLRRPPRPAGGGPKRAAVARDAGRPRVDHEADAGHGQRGLGHVGGNHDPAALGAGENPALLGRGQPGEQRQHLRAGRVERPQHLAGLADLPFAGQEDQHVPRASAAAGVPRRRWRRCGSPARHRAVADLHRIGAAGHLDDRRLPRLWRIGR